MSLKYGNAKMSKADKNLIKKAASNTAQDANPSVKSLFPKR